jgi:fructoselysine-6-P-deglycase FrlB-like protein
LVTLVWRAAGAEATIRATVAGNSAAAHALVPKTHAPDIVAPPAASAPPAPAIAHRTSGSTGNSAPSRRRTEPRARFSSCRTAPLLEPSRAAISS